MITKKNTLEQQTLKVCGRYHAEVLAVLKEALAPGITTKDLDTIAQEELNKRKCRSSFIGYKPSFAAYQYPASICVSINAQIVHGIPSDSVVIADGDVVSIDLGVVYQNMYTDAAITVIAGVPKQEHLKLIEVAESALFEGIHHCVCGRRIGDISHAIESTVQPHKYAIYRELVGHGVGYALHEDPYIPNYGNKGKGYKMEEGMVFAIEPMIGLGKEAIKTDKDGYTISTKDGSVAVHVEHTVIVTKEGPIVVTQI